MPRGKVQCNGFQICSDTHGRVCERRFKDTVGGDPCSQRVEDDFAHCSMRAQIVVLACRSGAGMATTPSLSRHRRWLRSASLIFSGAYHSQRFRLKILHAITKGRPRGSRVQVVRSSPGLQVCPRAASVGPLSGFPAAFVSWVLSSLDLSVLRRKMLGVSLRRT